MQQKTPTIQIQFNDPSWKRVPSYMMGETSQANDVWYDPEGIYLSYQEDSVTTMNAGILMKELDLDFNALQTKQDALRELYRQRFAEDGLELIDFQISQQAYNNAIPVIVSVIAKESLPGESTSFFASITVFPATMKAYDNDWPAEIAMWTQEDRNDAGTREKYVRQKDGTGNPFDSMYDNQFVFHALSKLRQKLENVSKNIRVTYS